MFEVVGTIETESRFSDFNFSFEESQDIPSLYCNMINECNTAIVAFEKYGLSRNLKKKKEEFRILQNRAFNSMLIGLVFSSWNCR